MGVTSYKDKEVQYDIDPSLLESDVNLDIDTVTVDGAARDSGNGTTTTLRAGLVLAYADGVSKYKEFNGNNSDGTEKDHRAVILGEETDVSGGDVSDVPVIYQGDVDESNIIVDGGSLTKSNVQRLNLED